MLLATKRSFLCLSAPPPPYLSQDKLLDGRTYMFFSHVIKGQLENMPLLDEILNKKVRLIDYETITSNGDPSLPRCVAFGQYAGKAGMVNTFRALGERLLSRGFSSPFISMGSAYQHQNYDQAMDAVRRLGEKIRADGTPKEFSPMIFVFTGGGNVSQGAQTVANELGDAFEWVEVSDLTTHSPYSLYTILTIHYTHYTLYSPYTILTHTLYSTYAIFTIHYTHPYTILNIRYTQHTLYSPYYR
jgi:hypothetical protein